MGKNIHNILDDKLVRVQSAMEHELESIILADVMEDFWAKCSIIQHKK